MTFSANISSVEKQNQIIAKLNGKTTPFNFNSLNGDLSAMINLKPGNNLIELIATCKCGTTKFSKSIEYASMIKKPAIQMNNFTQKAKITENTSESVTGSIQNISNKKDIKVLVDGQPIAFHFDHISKKINFNIDLENGSNMVTVIATNTAGAERKQIEIIKKGLPPTLHLSKYDGFSSENNPFKVNTSTITIQGYSNHHDSNTELTIVTNPSNKARVKYNKVSGILAGTMFLEKNQISTLIIEIKNQFGSSKKKLYFIHKVKNKPIIPPVLNTINKDEEINSEKEEENKSDAPRISNENKQEEESSDSSNETEKKPSKKTEPVKVSAPKPSNSNQKIIQPKIKAPTKINNNNKKSTIKSSGGN